jgi:Rrf2 family protein
VSVAANSRLTIAVHALTWLALAHQRGHERLTSDQVAASVRTNPVILRVSLGRLRQVGLVEVSHGARAGWRLARPAEQISLSEVYDAVESQPLFGVHRTEPNQQCPVGRGIRPVLDEIYSRVADVVVQELSRRSIADVLRDTLRRSENAAISDRGAASVHVAPGPA